jgi:glycosyltransferase involved in cell wall biosynthesis
VFATSYSSVSCENTHFVDQPRAYHDRERLRILFVGSFAQMYKGADVLIKAVEALLPAIAPAVTFVGDGKHRPEMEQLCRRLRVSENFTFLGELPSGQAVRDQMDKATLFVMPSRTEGLPRAMIEAMTRALPCIGTRVGGIPELLDDADLVDSGDVSGLAAKIHEVASDPGRLSLMSVRNLKRVQEYRPEILTQRRNEFYRFLRRASEGWLSVVTGNPGESVIA